MVPRGSKVFRAGVAAAQDDILAIVDPHNGPYVAWILNFAHNDRKHGGARVGTIQPASQPFHSTLPTLPVIQITPARENYHCHFPLVADNEERHHVTQYLRR